ATHNARGVSVNLSLHDALPISRDLRVPQEPEQVNHPNGATGVAGITVLVRDLQTSTREYEAILGTTAQDLRSPFDDRQLGAILPDRKSTRLNSSHVKHSYAV